MKRQSLALVVLLFLTLATPVVAERPGAELTYDEACVALNAKLAKLGAKYPRPIVQTRDYLDEQGKVVNRNEVKLLAAQQAAFCRSAKPEEFESRSIGPFGYIENRIWVMGNNGRTPLRPGQKSDLRPIENSLEYISLDSLLGPRIASAGELLSRPHFAESNPLIANPLKAMLTRTDLDAMMATGKLDWSQDDFRYAGKVAADGLIEQLDFYVHDVKRIAVTNHYDDSIVVPLLLPSDQGKDGNRARLDNAASGGPPRPGVKAFGFAWNIHDGHLIVVQIAPRSPAAKAGLERATLITAINGNDVSTLDKEQATAFLAAEKCHLKTILPDDSIKEFDLEKTDPGSWTE